MEIFARDLSNKTVVDSSGSIIGKLHNITMNYSSGSLESLLVLPEGDPTDKQIHKSDYSYTNEGYYLIDADSVRSIKDQIIVG